jgi:hypothetical protein
MSEIWGPEHELREYMKALFYLFSFSVKSKTALKTFTNIKKKTSGIYWERSSHPSSTKLAFTKILLPMPPNCWVLA